MHAAIPAESDVRPGIDGDAGVGGRPQVCADVRADSLFSRQRLLGLLPVVLGIVLVVALSLAWRQAVQPYIEHDDWDSLMPVTPARQAYVHHRLLSEGRWLNYWWWLGPGHSFSPVGASLLYQLGYLSFVARIAPRWAPGWLGLPVAVALFASPMIVETSFWPATLGLSVVLAALAAWTLPFCVARDQTLAPWIVTVVLVCVLTYPPLTFVLWLVLVVELIDASWTRLIRATAMFGAAYALAVVAVFSLNAGAFGRFGIVAQAWRHPRQLHGLHDLAVNLGRYGRQLRGLVTTTTIPVVLALCALAACFVLPGLRRRAVRLVLAVVVVLALEAGPPILDGVATPYRGDPWLWLLTVVPLMWLAREQALPWLRDRAVPWARVLQVLAVVALVAVGGWGIRYWRTAIHYNQHRLALYDRVEQRLHRAVLAHPSSRVYVYGDAADWANGVFRQEVQYLRARAADSYGISAGTCWPTNCRLPERPAVAAHLQRGTRLIVSGGVILVVPPSHFHLHQTFH